MYEVKRSLNLHFLLALESADVGRTCRKDGLPSFAFLKPRNPGALELLSPSMKSCGAVRGAQHRAVLPRPKMSVMTITLFWKYPWGIAGFILYQSFCSL